MDTLSLDASVAITGISRRTLWRRVTDGTIGRCDTDGRSRAMLALGDVLGLVDVALTAEDKAMLLRADAGDAEAQADMGALFYVAGAHKAALYWLNEAAAQDNAEAMQWLGTAYASGGGGQLHTEGCKPRHHVAGQGGCTRAPHRPAADGAAARGVWVGFGRPWEAVRPGGRSADTLGTRLEPRLEPRSPS